MRIKNADSRDYNFYEVIIIPKNEKEFDSVYDKLDNYFDLNIEDWGEEVDVISVSLNKTHFLTKEELIKDIRKSVKGK